MMNNSQIIHTHQNNCNNKESSDLFLEKVAQIVEKMANGTTNGDGLQQQKQQPRMPPPHLSRYTNLEVSLLLIFSSNINGSGLFYGQKWFYFDEQF
jgi:hypothetical protein